MTFTRFLVALLLGFVGGLVTALMVGCAPITQIPIDPNGVRHTARLQFNTPLQAYMIEPGSIVDHEGKQWPLLFTLDLSDKVMVCFEHRTNAHTEDCTTLGTLRKHAQGKR